MIRPNGCDAKQGRLFSSESWFVSDVSMPRSHAHLSHYQSPCRNKKAPARCRVGRHRGDNVGALNECVRHVYERWLTGLKVFQNDQTIGSESSAFKVSGFSIFFGMATS